jgi:hypothetical protein
MFIVSYLFFLFLFFLFSKETRAMRTLNLLHLCGLLSRQAISRGFHIEGQATPDSMSALFVQSNGANGIGPGVRLQRSRGFSFKLVMGDALPRNEGELPGLEIQWVLLSTTGSVAELIAKLERHQFPPHPSYVVAKESVLEALRVATR